MVCPAPGWTRGGPSPAREPGRDGGGRLGHDERIPEIT